MSNAKRAVQAASPSARSDAAARSDVAARFDATAFSDAAASRPGPTRQQRVLVSAAGNISTAPCTQREPGAGVAVEAA